MKYLLLLGIYGLFSLFFKWLLSWGGAEKIEGWMAGCLIGWNAWTWDSEQIRLYELLAWAAVTVLFLFALVV